MAVAGARVQALAITNRYQQWSFAIGVVPLPMLDLVALTGVQLQMLSEISEAYEIPFEDNRVKSLIGSLLTSLVSVRVGYGIARYLCRAIPGVGWLLGWFANSVFSTASTHALAVVFIQHFESGGTVLDFDPDKVEAYYRRIFEDEVRERGRRDSSRIQTTQAMP